MPVFTAGVYKVDVTYGVGSDQFRNVFWYRGDNSAVGGAPDLSIGFLANVIPNLFVLLHQNVVGQELSVEEVGSINPVIVLDISANVGGQVGDIASNFISAPFRLIRTTRDVGNGAKRVGPMAEQNIEGNVFSVAYLAAMDDARDDFAASIVQGGFTFIPALVKRTTLPPASPITGSEVSAVITVNRVTTQNSRKAGVGD